MAYSLKDKLRQLAEAKAGEPYPAFLQERLNDWGDALGELAKEALAEIERLELIAGDPADGG